MSLPLNLRLTESAEADLAEIWLYLAEEVSEVIATQFVGGIKEKFAPLQHTPLIGAPRDRFCSNLRVVFYPPYAIYYLTTDRDLIIVRVLHGARDAKAIADQGGFDS